MTICSSPFFFDQMETISEKQDYLKMWNIIFLSASMVSCHRGFSTAFLFPEQVWKYKNFTAYFDSNFQWITNSVSNLSLKKRPLKAFFLHQPSLWNNIQFWKLSPHTAQVSPALIPMYLTPKWAYDNLSDSFTEQKAHFSLAALQC